VAQTAFRGVYFRQIYQKLCLLMKQLLIPFLFCLLGAISIVAFEEYTDAQARFRQGKFYKLENGMTYYGTNEEALRLNKYLREKK